MTTIKEEVIEMLRRLPDDITIEEIQYSLYLCEKAKAAQKALAEGDVYTQEEVKEIIRGKWLAK